MFSVCSHREGGYPSQVQMGGGGYPKVGTPAKVGTHSVRSGWGVFQGRYTPGPGIGQLMEYLLRCGRYSSCVRARGLSCLKSIFGNWKEITMGY